MSCTFCASNNQRVFPAEVNIHFPGLENADKPGVFVFPKLLVCLDCGSSSFMTPTSEVARLAGAGASTATEKPVRTDCLNSR
jgi:hypothetical protein